MSLLIILCISPSSSSPHLKVAPFLVSALRFLVSCRRTLLKEAKEVAHPRKDFTCLQVVGLGYFARPDILSGSGWTPSLEITTPAKLICSVLNWNLLGCNFTLNSLHLVKSALVILLKAGKSLA